MEIDLKSFADALLTAYLKGQTVPLPYNEFWANGFNTLYNNPKQFGVDKVESSTHIRIAPSTQEILKILNEHSDEFDDIKPR